MTPSTPSLLHSDQPGPLHPTRGPARPRPGTLQRALIRYRPAINALALRYSRYRLWLLGPEDLSSVAEARLMRAYDEFDQSLGVEFGTYAMLRVRGAMIDAMRSADPLSRELRVFRHVHAETRRRLRQELQREPTALETADALGCGLDRYEELRLTIAQRCRPQRRRCAELVPQGVAGRPDDLVEQKDLWDRLMELVDGLPPRSRQVLRGLYAEGRSSTEMAQRLGLTQGRITQLHKEGLRRLRGAWNAARLLDDEAALPPLPMFCLDEDAP